MMPFSRSKRHGTRKLFHIRNERIHHTQILFGTPLRVVPQHPLSYQNGHGNVEDLLMRPGNLPPMDVQVKLVETFAQAPDRGRARRYLPGASLDADGPQRRSGHRADEAVGAWREGRWEGGAAGGHRVLARFVAIRQRCRRPSVVPIPGSSLLTWPSPPTSSLAGERAADDADGGKDKKGGIFLPLFVFLIGVNLRPASSFGLFAGILPDRAGPNLRAQPSFYVKSHIRIVKSHRNSLFIRC